MNSTKDEFVAHLKDVGLHLIGQNLCNVTLRKTGGHPYDDAMSLVHIAHGTELLIKAKIASEHPLLLCKTIPSSTTVDNKLGLFQLLEHGQPIPYAELPERLMASTGYEIKNMALYSEFGKLRNQIMHLAIPKIDLVEICLLFCYEVVEEMIYDWWGINVSEYAATYDSRYLESIFDVLDSYEIRMQNLEVRSEKSEVKSGKWFEVGS